MLPIKHLIPEQAIKYCQFQKDKYNLMQNLSNTYKPICFDEFNINPYPLLFNEELIKKINDCHALIIEAINKLVTNFFNDPLLQQIISLNDTALNLLYPLKDKPYKIGAIRPDFLFNKDYQLKICEINARFPLNAFIITQCLSTEIHKQFGDKSIYFGKKLIEASNFFKQFFDCPQPIYLFFDKEKSFEIFLLKNSLKKTSSNLKLVTPSECLSKDNLFTKEDNDYHSFKVILNLHQEELVNLEGNLLNAITSKTYFNDLRTILIVHDKRLLSILSSKTIMSKYLSSKKCNRLASYIIPTYTLTDNTIQNIKTNPKNWVLKKVSTGKGEGMYIGKETPYAEILTILNEKKPDYIAQPFIKQPLFKLLNNANASKPKGISHNDDAYQAMYLVGSMLSFNNVLLRPGILRGSHKTIINVAQGGTTIFLPIF